MYLRTIAARIASATLLGTLAFGAAGAGTAAAASSTNQHASIHIDTAAPAMWLRPGGSFTDTFVVSNPDKAGTHDVSLLMTYPSTVQLQGVQFDRAGAWVDSTMGNSFDAKLGNIGSHGDSITMLATFKALPGYSAGAPLQAQLEDTWRDNSSTTNHHDISSVPILAVATSQPIMAAPAPSVGIVNVTPSGFAPGEPVTFWYNLPNGTAAPLYIRNGQLTTEKAHRNATADANGNRDVDNETALYADANGQVNTSFPTIGLEPGAYSIVARGQTDGTNDVVLFGV